ncbi:MAG: SgcJ/EcaC family oxidoreductase [Candidatus Binatota bacterium]|nr:SgcJ/EcaC family oxidoreductase [Candidatus Binatota bacterium]
MQNDEQAIRDLIASWMNATVDGELSRILPLMAQDVVFLIAGQALMRGRDAFAAAFQAGLGKVRIEPKSTIQKIQVDGNLAYCWNHLQVVMTPLSGGSPMRRSGYTLTVLRREPDGRWVVFRDANMLTPEP